MFYKMRRSSVFSVCEFSKLFFKCLNKKVCQFYIKNNLIIECVSKPTPCTRPRPPIEGCSFNKLSLAMSAFWYFLKMLNQAHESQYSCHFIIICEFKTCFKTSFPRNKRDSTTKPVLVNFLIHNLCKTPLSKHWDLWFCQQLLPKIGDARSDKI